MTHHCPDLRSPSDWLNQISHGARPIRSTTQIWVMMRHEISALVSQTSFGGETSGTVAKCRLFFQVSFWSRAFFGSFMCFLLVSVAHTAERETPL